MAARVYCVFTAYILQLWLSRNDCRACWYNNNVADDYTAAENGAGSDGSVPHPASSFARPDKAVRLLQQANTRPVFNQVNK